MIATTCAHNILGVLMQDKQDRVIGSPIRDEQLEALKKLLAIETDQSSRLDILRFIEKRLNELSSKEG